MSGSSDQQFDFPPPVASVDWPKDNGAKVARRFAAEMRSDSEHGEEFTGGTDSVHGGNGGVPLLTCQPNLIPLLQRDMFVPEPEPLAGDYAAYDEGGGGLASDPALADASASGHGESSHGLDTGDYAEEQRLGDVADDESEGGFASDPALADASASSHGESSHGLDTADPVEEQQLDGVADDHGCMALDGRAYGAPYDPNAVVDQREGHETFAAEAGGVDAAGVEQPAADAAPPEQSLDWDGTLGDAGSGGPFGDDNEGVTVLAGNGDETTLSPVNGSPGNRHEEGETWIDQDGEYNAMVSSQGTADPTFVEVTNIDKLASDLNIELDLPEVEQSRKPDYGDWQGVLLTVATGSLVLAVAVSGLRDHYYPEGGAPEQGETAASGTLEPVVALADVAGESLASWLGDGLAVAGGWAGGWFQPQQSVAPEESPAAEPILAEDAASSDAEVVAADTGIAAEDQDQLFGFGQAQDDEQMPWHDAAAGDYMDAAADPATSENAGNAFEALEVEDEAVADSGEAPEETAAQQAGAMVEEGPAEPSVNQSGADVSRILFATNESFSDELLEWYSGDDVGSVAADADSAANDAGSALLHTPRGSAEEPVKVAKNGTLLPISDLVADGRPLPWWHPSSVWRHSDLPGITATDEGSLLAGLASPVLDSRTPLLTEETGSNGRREYARLLGVGTLKPLPLK